MVNYGRVFLLTNGTDLLQYGASRVCGMSSSYEYRTLACRIRISMKFQKRPATPETPVTETPCNARSATTE